MFQMPDKIQNQSIVARHAVIKTRETYLYRVDLISANINTVW